FAIELLQPLPGQMGVQSDAGSVADEGAATLVADDGEAEVRTAPICLVESLQQQQAALGLEQVLGDEKKHRLVVVLRPFMGLDRAHARADGRDLLRWQA